MVGPTEEEEMGWEMKGEASATIGAPADRVYELITDITRMGEWSPECVGGEWQDASGPAEGAIFNGHNKRGDNEWTTPNTVISAKPGEEFVWVVGTPETVACTWGFRLQASGDSTTVTQFFELGPSEMGFRGMVAGAPEEQRQAMIDGRTKQLIGDMEQTLDKISAAAQAS